jgi:hypothetical protein
LNRTIDDVLKFEPLTVKVNAISPAHLVVGEIVEIVGTGLFTAKELLVPVGVPPEVLAAVIVTDEIANAFVTL